jgi:hypothetical protein
VVGASVLQHQVGGWNSTSVGYVKQQRQAWAALHDSTLSFRVGGGCICTATPGGLMAAALQLAMSSSSDKDALQLHDST